MRKLIILNLLFIGSLISKTSQAQNVGIGTTVPSANAILDVESLSKGLMLPRLNDTTAVSGPTAGLLIFNKTTASPNYYDGARWQNFTPSSANTVQDSITYTISSTSANLVIGTFNLTRMTHTGTWPGSGQPSMNTIAISKSFDLNSIPFKRMFAGTSSNPTIECKVYTPGTSTPYYSVKLSNWTIRQEDFSVSSVDGKMLENYLLTGPIIGFKDWINNQSFSWNSITVVVGSY